MLPDFDTVIIDEAHELQDRVTSSVTRPLSVNMVQTAASAARKHCAVSVDSLNQGAKALQRSLEGVPTGLMARGLNEEQEAAINQIAEAARVVLSDSKPEANAPADGGRQMARSQVMYLVEQCDQDASKCPRTAGSYLGARARGISARGRAMSSRTRSKPADAECRTPVGCRQAARRPLRRTHRHPDQRDPGHRRGL